jgi:hypothetical protein
MGLILQAVATDASTRVRYEHAAVTPEPVWSFGLLHLSSAFCSVGTSQPFWNCEAVGQSRCGLWRAGPRTLPDHEYPVGSPVDHTNGHLPLLVSHRLANAFTFHVTS